MRTKSKITRARRQEKEKGMEGGRRERPRVIKREREVGSMQFKYYRGRERKEREDTNVR